MGLRISRRSFGLAVTAAGATGVLGCRQPSNPNSKKPRVAYVTNGVASFWDIAKRGALDGGEKYGADVTVVMPNGATEQKQKIEDLIIRGIDAVAVSPIDAENQTPFLNEAAKKTILITQDADAPRCNRLMYLGMDNYVAGKMAGQLIKEAIPNGGKVGIFVGRLGQDNAKGRRQGIIDEVLGRKADPARVDPPGELLKGDKYTVLPTFTDQFDRAKAKSNCEDAISAHPDIACMIGLFAYNPPAIIEALRATSKLGKIKVVAFDEDEGTLQAIKDGYCHGAVVQNPYMYGMESIRIMVALTKGDKSVIPPGKIIEIPARQIRKDTVDEFWADLRKKMGK